MNPKSVGPVQETVPGPSTWVSLTPAHCSLHTEPGCLQGKEDVSIGIISALQDCY